MRQTPQVSIVRPGIGQGWFLLIELLTYLSRTTPWLGIWQERTMGTSNNWIHDRMSHQKILADFPSFTDADLLACLALAADEECAFQVISR